MKERRPRISFVHRDFLFDTSNSPSLDQPGKVGRLPHEFQQRQGHRRVILTMWESSLASARLTTVDYQGTTVLIGNPDEISVPCHILHVVGDRLNEGAAFGAYAFHRGL